MDRLRDLEAEAPLPAAAPSAAAAAGDDGGGKGKGKRRGDDVALDVLPATTADAATSSSATNEFMSGFFAEVGGIKDQMGQLRRNIRTVKDLASEIVVGSAGDEAAARKSRELNELITASNAIVGQLRARLEAMKKGNRAYADSRDATPAEVRIRTNMHNTLVTKFVDLAKAYNDVQTEYQAAAKERLERQCKVVRPELDDGEIREIVESGDVQVFASAILEKDLREKAREALRFVENKHNDIVRLKASIDELHQMFLDMATLVQAQGELVNHIEANCNKAEEYIERAVDELRKANKLQRKSRKKMCCLIVLISAILVVVVVLSSTLASIF